MRPAGGAVYLRAAHEEAAVFLGLYVCLVRGRPEARPASARVELGLRAEQRRPATHAAVDALALVVPVLPRKGTLRALHAGDAVLLRGELVLPLLLGLLHLSRRIGHADDSNTRPERVVLYCGTRTGGGRSDSQARDFVTVREGWRGRFFEDFDVGDVYEHPLGRTVTTTDNAWFTLLTQNTAPMLFLFHKYRGHRQTPLPVGDQGVRSRAGRASCRSGGAPLVSRSPRRSALCPSEKPAGRRDRLPTLLRVPCGFR